VPHTRPVVQQGRPAILERPAIQAASDLLYATPPSFSDQIAGASKPSAHQTAFLRYRPWRYGARSSERHLGRV